MHSHCFLLLVLLLLLQVAAAPATRAFTYTNPVTRSAELSLRDHYILREDGRWYCTGTSEPVWTGRNPGVRLLVSDDLLTWRHHSWLIDSSQLPEDCPYNGRFWAPEIHRLRGRFWMTVNSGRITKEDPKGMATHGVWLFVADAVTGPYTLVRGPLTGRYNNDATLFEDDDGRTYLYCSGDGLWQAPIDLESGALLKPVEKFLDKRQPGWPEWMMGGIEGPFVLKRDGVYFMFFSTWTRGYEVALLRSPGPLGPWTLVSEQPIFGTRKKHYRPELAREGGYSHLQYTNTEDPYCETGHNALFEGPDGLLWSSCHYLMDTKAAEAQGPAPGEWRHTPQLGIEPVEYRDGRFFIRPPTWTEQRVPPR